MLFSENYPECGMGPLHHEWRHLRGIVNTMWSYVYPLLNEQVEKFCYCPSHNIPLGGGESQIQVVIEYFWRTPPRPLFQLLKVPIYMG